MLDKRKNREGIESVTFFIIFQKKSLSGEEKRIRKICTCLFFTAMMFKMASTRSNVGRYASITITMKATLNRQELFHVPPANVIIVLMVLNLVFSHCLK